MESEIRKLNAQQRVTVWTQRIADCQSSGQNVKTWCEHQGISKKMFYYWQKRVSETTKPIKEAAFADITCNEPQPMADIIAMLEIKDVQVQVFTGADEKTLTALFAALRTC